MNLREHLNYVEAYGTSEGVKKAWDSRGRGRTRGQEVLGPARRLLDRVERKGNQIADAYEEGGKESLRDWVHDQAHDMGIPADIIGKAVNMVTEHLSGGKQIEDDDMDKTIPIEQLKPRP